MRMRIYYFQCYWPSNLVFAVIYVTYSPNMRKIGQKPRLLLWTNGIVDRGKHQQTSDMICPMHRGQITLKQRLSQKRLKMRCKEILAHCQYHTNNITVQNVSAYTVVRAIPLVNGRWRFSATWGSGTPEPIELKFGTIDYVGHPTPQAKTGLRRFTGVWWGQG